MSPFRLAFLSLTRRRVPTLIALVSISLSVAFSGVLLRLYVLSGSRFTSIATGPDAVVGAKAGGIEILLGALNSEGSYPGFIPYKLYSSLKTKKVVQFEDGVQSEPSFIKSVIPFVYFGKVKQYRVIGTDDSFLNRPVGEDGLSLAEGRWVKTGAEVVLGADVAKKEGFKVGQDIEVTQWTSDTVGSTSTISMRVVGTLVSTSKAWDNALYSSVGEAWQVFQGADIHDQTIWKEQVLNYFLIYLEPGGFPQLEALINRRTIAQSIDVKRELEQLEKLTGTGRRLGLMVSLLIVLLSALGVTAMMVARFEAMGTQLAVLRAMGYEKSEVRQWLLWEGSLLGIFASLIGGIFDLALFPVVRNQLSDALPSYHLVTVGIFNSSPIWLMAIVGTMLATFIPLYRLYHQDVHTALKA